MGETKHTPGPWRSGRSDMMSYDASGTIAFKNIYADDPRGGTSRGKPLSVTVAKAVEESALYAGVGARPLSGEEIIANARLIAAAPDLLAAAQKVLSHKRGEDDWLILAVHCRDLEAAIAKATGADNG